MTLARLRGRIDRIDSRLVGLLNARARQVRAVAAWKLAHGAPVHDARREHAVLRGVLKANGGPLDGATLERIYSALVWEFREFERREQRGKRRSSSFAEGWEGGARERTTVAVVGMGLIGGSLALDLRRWTRHRLVGCVKRGQRADPRLRAIVDEATDEPARACAADLVVLAMPLGEILRWLERWGPRAKPGSVWTDVAGLKAPVCRAASRFLAGGAAFVGGHPMAGSARSGLGAAREGLFEGATYVLTPGPNAESTAVRRLEAFARTVGAEPFVLRPEEHDRLVAYTSHLPQFVSSALAAAAAEALRNPAGRRLAGPGLRDTTRLADSGPEIWKDVAALNGRHLEAAMRTFLKRMKEAADLSPRGVESLFRKSRAARRLLSSARRGPGRRPSAAGREYDLSRGAGRQYAPGAPPDLGGCGGGRGRG